MGSSPSSQYHRVSSGSHQNDPHPSQFLGQMPPHFGDFDPTKLAKSPLNQLKMAPNLNDNKEFMQGKKPPSEGPLPSDASGAANISDLPLPTPAASVNSNRKCRALYGFEQKI